MPFNRDAYIRYRLIDERLRKKPAPTFEALYDYVCDKLGKSIGRRTLQLDIQEMRYNQALGFQAPIVYNAMDKTYRYADENYSIHNLPVSADELHGIDFAISVLDQFKHLPAIKEFEEAIKRIATTVRFNKEVRGEADYIQFERQYAISGIEYVEPIVKAIRERRVIQFDYLKHGSRRSDFTLLEPYIIKESKNFWYVIGRRVNKPEKSIRTFALDRMSNLKLTEDAFEEQPIDKKSLFSNVVGITIGTGKPENIVLRFSPLQGKYIKTVPIHASQKILRENEEYLEVGLHVVINPELKMQLLSYGQNVKVIKPRRLADDIKNEAQQVLKLYK
ncbi:MAG: WYL domain-containing protein [Chitinophagales bacterium]|nr:WYL domain-containing protein [Chitinophagales bacterium]MDW8418209.1 WYL domain-containing protein [Chitinophagales bacterium]